MLHESSFGKQAALAKPLPLWTSVALIFLLLFGAAIGAAFAFIEGAQAARLQQLPASTRASRWPHACARLRAFSGHVRARGK